jgi:segregation and condensation protein B
MTDEIKPSADAAEPAPADAVPSIEPRPEAAAAAGHPNPVSEAELRAMQDAEEAKGDPALEDVEAASIEVQEGGKDEPFDKLVTKAKRFSPERVRAIVEALLFLAERPLTPEEVRAASGIDIARVRKAFDELSGKHREGVSGIVLHEVAGGWQLRSSPDVAEHARRFLKVKPQRLTRAALETLAIIAYRQPVTRPEIEEIRGVDSGAVVKALLERKLIKILGKKEEPGRPILYGTTREFLEFFALKDLASLPTLREFHELSEEHRDIVEKETPPDEGPRLEGLVAELADPALRAALEAGRAEGDAALDDLERAIEAADVKTRAAQAALEPRPAEGDAPPLGGAMTQPGSPAASSEPRPAQPGPEGTEGTGGPSGAPPAA